jgi:dTMP kinase
MAFLVSASRTELVAEVIRPALERGEIVITDRFADSTIAYQTFGLGVPLGVSRELVRIATGGLSPNVVIYVDVPPQIGLERTAARGAGNRLDGETLAFHERVRQGYQQLICENPERWIAIDGSATVETVHDRIYQSLEPFLPEVAKIG